MGLARVATIATVAFAEKLVPRGDAMARLFGVVLVTIGIVALVQPEVAALLKVASLGGK